MKTLLFSIILIMVMVQVVYAEPNWPPADYLAGQPQSVRLQQGRVMEDGNVNNCQRQSGNALPAGLSVVQGTQYREILTRPMQQFAAYGYNPYQNLYAQNRQTNYSYQRMQSLSYSNAINRNALVPFDPYGMSSMYPVPVIPATVMSPMYMRGYLPLINPWQGLPW